MELQAFKVIDCPKQSIISKKVVDFLSEKTNLLDDQDHQLWNKIDTVALLKQVPEILEFYQSLNLKLREIAITVCNRHRDIDLHIDELPVVAKINFPILNTKNTFNEWYRVPQQIIDSTTPILNQFNSAYYDLGHVDLSLCDKIAEYELNQPIVFNSQVPHKIRITKETKFPRVVMSCTFFNEPLQWLVK